jgi:uncharacterized protein YgiM (DUF1202 family)
MGRRTVFFVVIVLFLASAACSVNFSPNNADNSSADLQSAPLVLLLAPVNGSTYAEGTRVELHAIAQDTQVGVSRIDFLVDSATVDEVPATDPNGQASLEAQFTWTATGKQGHLITVEAFRADGSSLGRNEVLVHVADKPSATGSTANAPASTTEPSPGAATPVPTPTSAPTARPDDMGILSGPLARVNTSTLNVRQGPGTNYAPVGTLVQDDQVQIVGRNVDSSWWAIQYGNGTGWVIASLVITEGDVSQVPLVAAP